MLKEVLGASAHELSASDLALLRAQAPRVTILDDLSGPSRSRASANVYIGPTCPAEIVQRAQSECAVVDFRNAFALRQLTLDPPERVILSGLEIGDTYYEGYVEDVVARVRTDVAVHSVVVSLFVDDSSDPFSLVVGGQSYEGPLWSDFAGIRERLACPIYLNLRSSIRRSWIYLRDVPDIDGLFCLITQTTATGVGQWPIAGTLSQWCGSEESMWGAD